MWKMLQIVALAAAPLLLQGVQRALGNPEPAPPPPPLSVACRVDTDTGPVLGYNREADYGEQYFSFRGVPYAKQPVGELRFKRLERSDTWSAALEAHDEGPACPQHTLFYAGLVTPRGHDEACIHLNVHVPPRAQLCSPSSPPAPRPGAEREGYAEVEVEDEEEAPLPVLVWVHGGGFGYGSGDADFNGPEYLVAKGVLVVTFNYRLGALGFLSLETPQLPGNLGLHDAVEALRWVRRNIAAFGGDPDNVTLAGHSAGAAVAHLLTMSSTADGLYHRVILMSGAATRSWFSTSSVNAKRVAETLLRRLNITSSEPAERLRALRAASVADLVAATRAMQDAEGLVTFAPVVERTFDAVEPFLAHDPERGASADVPLLVGHTDAECHSFANRFREIEFVATAARNRLALVPPSLQFAASPERLARVVAAIERRYFPGGDVTLERLLEYCTDAYYAYPAAHAARAAAARRGGGGARVFAYEFAYGSASSAVRRVIAAGHEYAGAAHGEDVGYVLRVNSHSPSSSAAPGSLDHYMKEWMTILFSNFIKTGSPAPASEWPPLVSPGPELSLLVNGSLGPPRAAAPRRDMIDFFDELHDPAPACDVAPPASALDDIAQPSIYLLPPKTD